MKAFLLAAGLGTRLRPYTYETPKCMLPIGGKPLIDHWLVALDRAGVTEIHVNMHYRADIVREHLALRSAFFNIHTTYEPRLLGSAGTLLENKDWVADEELFLACNADGLTDFCIADLIHAHREHRQIATIATYRTENPSASGILKVNFQGIMTEFTEKPEHPVSDLANAGMYVFSPEVLTDIDEHLPQDIGRDLLPQLVGYARTVPVTGYYRDIGTPEDYRLAQEEWAAR